MNSPDFIGIGAQKAATTWLYDILYDHPEVGMSETKEVDFFSRFFERGYQWYERQFPDSPARCALGEMSPSYLAEPSVPARIAAYLPNVKIIVSLREPVSRLISNHKHEVRIGHFGGEDLTIEAGLRNNPCYVEQGRYATHLNRWFAHFPRDQILVLLYDDILAEPDRVAHEVYNFLGVDPDFVSAALQDRSNVGHVKRHPQIDAIRRRIRLALVGLGVGWIWESLAQRGLRRLYRRIGWMDAESRIPEVSPEQEDRLKEIFRDDIKALEGLLGCSLYHWTSESSHAETSDDLGPPSERPAGTLGMPAR